MIYVVINGTQQGPFSIGQINSMLAAHQIRPADLSWWEGCANWVPIATAPEVVLPAAAAPAPQSVPGSVYAPPAGRILNTPSGSAAVSPATVEALRQTRPWVLFLAILGIIGTGLMLLGGLFMLAGGAMAMTQASSAMGPGGAKAAGFMGGFMTFAVLMFLVIAVVYLYPISKLLKYAGAIARLSRSGAVRDLEDALQQQKSFWKFVGIMVIVIFTLYILAFIAIFVMGVGAAGAFSGASGRPGFSAPP
jgi:hypothetical protein